MKELGPLGGVRRVHPLNPPMILLSIWEIKLKENYLLQILVQVIVKRKITHVFKARNSESQTSGTFVPAKRVPLPNTFCNPKAITIQKYQ